MGPSCRAGRVDQFWSADWALAPFREPYFHRSAYACGPRVETAREILARVPAGARVAAAHYFLPHLLDRPRVYLLHDPDRIPPDATEAVFDRARENSYFPVPAWAMQEALAREGFRVVEDRDGIVRMARVAR